MTAAIAAQGLGKRYRRTWALADCTLSIPAGQIVGLVGPNGAGKTTLLHMAIGMLEPTSGTIEVLGGRPASGPAQLAKVGFVAQDAPEPHVASGELEVRVADADGPDAEGELTLPRDVRGV